MARNDAFRSNLRLRVAKAEKKIDLAIRYTVMGMAQRLVNRSPVDTGRFRGNWQFGVASVNTDTSSSPDSSGAGSIGRIMRGLSTVASGQKIFVTNSLPYARRLEYGWSKQAPGGMVRLTVAEFKSVLREAVSNAKATTV